MLWAGSAPDMGLSAAPLLRRGSSAKSPTPEELVELKSASDRLNLHDDEAEAFACTDVMDKTAAVNMEDGRIDVGTEVNQDDVSDLTDLIDTSQFMADGNIRSQLPSRSSDVVIKKIMPAEADVPSARTMSLPRAARLSLRGARAKSVYRARSRSMERRNFEDILMKPFGASVPQQQPTNAYYDATDAETEVSETTTQVQVLRLEGPIDEGERWHGLQQVRHLTLSLKEKRNARNSLLRQEATPLESFAKLEHLQNQYWATVKKQVRNFFSFRAYRNSLKKIEGHFGSGIALYFRLVIWVTGLNLVLTLTTLPIIVPQALTSGTFLSHYNNYSSGLCHELVNLTYGTIVSQNFSNTLKQAYGVAADQTINGTSGNETWGTMPNQSYNAVISSASGALSGLEAAAFCCSAVYKTSTEDPNRPWYKSLLDVLQGTGILENTLLFYGYYFDQRKTSATSSSVPGESILPAWYNMSAAYLLVTALFFLVSLAFVVYRTSIGLYEAVLSEDAAPWKYTCKVLGGWDYNLSSASSAKVKHVLIKQELQSEIADDMRMEAAKNRTRGETVRLIIIRALVNVGSLFFFIGAGAAVYFAQQFCDAMIHAGGLDLATELAVQFFPSALITLLYIICPPIFTKLATIEQYLPANQLIITLARIVLVRLATLFILLVPVYVLVMECEWSEVVCGSCQFGRLKCWETYIGQQMYKLVVMDLVVNIAVIFIFEFPRKKVYDVLHSRMRLVESLGQEEFNVPVNVMDLVYTQTLCWIGTFFSPLIPLITFLKTIIFFHLKKLSLVHNQKPSASPYRASKVIFYFMLVLTLAFGLGVFAIGITISLIQPSQGCGPFRVYREFGKVSIFSSIRSDLKTMPPLLQEVVRVVTSYSFQFPLITVLCLAIYFFVAMATSRSRRTEILKLQLTMETQNKDFLVRLVNKSLRKELTAASTKSS